MQPCHHQCQNTVTVCLQFLLQILISLVQFLWPRCGPVHNDTFFFFVGLWEGVIFTSKIFNPSMSISFSSSLFLRSYVSGGRGYSNVQNLVGKSRFPKSKIGCLSNAYVNHVLSMSCYYQSDVLNIEFNSHRFYVLQGMDLYLKRHDGQAVTCDDFYAAMRDANNADFANFLLWFVFWVFFSSIMLISYWSVS